MTMAQSAFPTPPQTPPLALVSSGTKQVSEVSIEHLDSLLETYLGLLDEYTNLRTQLSKLFSDGFFSLARANHISPNLGSGRRYGEEGYDERMKAQRRVVHFPEVSIQDSDETSTKAEPMRLVGEEKKEDHAAERQDSRISIQRTNNDVDADQLSARDLKQRDGSEATGQSSIADSFRALASSPSPTTPRSSCDNKLKVKTLSSSRDPLNWYGILIPQPLREAQAAFVSAVESCIPQLHNVSATMRELETQISGLRIELGLRPDEVVEPDSDGKMQT